MGTNLLPFFIFFSFPILLTYSTTGMGSWGYVRQHFPLWRHCWQWHVKGVPIRWLISSRLWFISDSGFEHNAKHDATAYILSVTVPDYKNYLTNKVKYFFYEQAESSTLYTTFITVHLTKGLGLFDDYWRKYLYIFLFVCFLFKLRRPSSISFWLIVRAEGVYCFI